MVFAANGQSDTSKNESFALNSTVNAANARLDITGTRSTTGQSSVSSSTDSSSGSGAQPDQQALGSWTNVTASEFSKYAMKLREQEIVRVLPLNEPTTSNPATPNAHGNITQRH
jgi:hypothetical protein